MAVNGDELIELAPGDAGRGAGRGGGRLAARAAAGLAGIALAAATVWAAEAVPLPGLRAAPVSLVLSPVPGEQQRVCPGPLTLLGQSASSPSAVGYKGYAEISTAGTTEGLEVAGLVPAVDAAVSVAAPSDSASGVPTVFSAPGIVGDRATSVVIAQSAAVAQPGAAGFAATTCRAPAADQWLVGGATTEGTSTVLSLVNPTAATAIVRVALAGVDGSLAAPGLDGIEVPARSQIAVSLEGVAPGQQAFVVHLTTRGAGVSASLHEVGLDGLTATGIEIVGATRPPSTRLDIVGVPFPTSSNEEDESVFANRGATLRLFAPGDDPVNVTVTLRDAAGVELAPLTLTLAPGVVSDVPLGAYPVGRYTVTVEGSAPLVGGLRTALVAPPTDFAWYTPSAPIDGTTDVAVAPGPGARLQLASAGATPVTVTLTDAAGSQQRLAIEPGQTVSVPVSAGAYRLEGMLDTVASVSYDGPGQMAGVSVVRGSPLADDITVYR